MATHSRCPCFLDPHPVEGARAAQPLDVLHGGLPIDQAAERDLDGCLDRAGTRGPPCRIQELVVDFYQALGHCGSISERVFDISCLPTARTPAGFSIDYSPTPGRPCSRPIRRSRAAASPAAAVSLQPKLDLQSRLCTRDPHCGVLHRVSVDFVLRPCSDLERGGLPSAGRARDSPARA